MALAADVKSPKQIVVDTSGSGEVKMQVCKIVQIFSGISVRAVQHKSSLL